MEEREETGSERQRTEDSRKRKRRRRKRRNSVVSGVLFVLCLAIFLFAAYKLYNIFNEYHKGDSNYDKLQIYVEVPEDGDPDGNLQIDFKKLLEENGDLVAWIRIGGNINISYPVMQSEDNNYYLRRLFNKTHNILGSIFMDYSCSADLSDDNTIIYGHNTKNGSMFGGLKKWKEKKEYENNPYFYLYTTDGRVHKYQVCSVVVTDSRAEDYTLEFADAEEFRSWENAIQAKSLYDTGVELDENAQIVTLSTCTNRTEEERLVVHGVKIETRECGK